MMQERQACPLTKGERILVAVDGSKYSDMALVNVINMAKVCNSKFFVINVIELYHESF